MPYYWVLADLCRHRGLDPRSPVQWALPSCSGDGGSMPAMTLKRVMLQKKMILISAPTQ